MGWQANLGDRLTVGHRPLKPRIGVRIPVPQPRKIPTTKPPQKGGLVVVSRGKPYRLTRDILRGPRDKFLRKFVLRGAS